MNGYSKRIVVFLDILNFKGLIAESQNSDKSDNALGIDKIEKAIEIIRDYLKSDESEESKADIKVTQFSDCAVLSFNFESESQIFYRFYSLKLMLINFICNGILCRGGISVGSIKHTNTVVFGPALVEAYLLESTAAFYPRIVVSEDIVNMAGKHRQRHHSAEEEINYVKNLLVRDTDGLYYIDYFDVAGELDYPEYDFHYYLLKMHTMIVAGIGNDAPGVRVKYMWMKEKYNKIVKNIKHQIKKGNYHPEDPDVLEAYSSLPII